jgi:lantibiotic modifying enzyme
MSDRLLIYNKIEQVASLCKQFAETCTFYGLLNGLSGIGLFLYLFSKLSMKTKDENSYIALENSLKLVDENTPSYTFCDGLSGLGFLLSFLERTEMIASDVDVNINIDKYLYRCFIYCMERKNHDFLHGGTQHVERKNAWINIKSSNTF